MDLTCIKCGFSSEYNDFKYLCQAGCPACGEADLRECPRCGNKCLFSRSESLEGEHGEMKELSKQLESISNTDGPDRLEEAKELIRKLRKMNLRWNIPALDAFIKKRQRAIFL